MLLCMHCLEEGNWTDEDKCPRCARKGHVSPWEVSKCPACNQEFTDSMKELQDRVTQRKNFNAVIASLQYRVAQLEKTVQSLSERLTDAGVDRIGI